MRRKRRSNRPAPLGISSAAERSYLNAERAFHEGNLDGAKMSALQAMVLADLCDEPEKTGVAAAASQVLLNVALAEEDFEAMLVTAGVAREHLQRLNLCVNIADVDRIEAEARSRLGDESGAQQLIMRARNTFANERDDLGVATCDMQRARMAKSTDHELVREGLHSARVVFARASQDVLAAQCDSLLATHALYAEDYEQAQTLLTGVLETMLAHNMLLDAARARSSIGLLFVRQAKYREAIGPLQLARKVLGDAGQYPMLANCHWHLATAYEKLGDDDRALDSALAALATFTEQRYAMHNPSSREGWAKSHIGLTSLAVDLACRRGDHRLVAELVESARGQGIPAQPGQAWSSSRSDTEEFTRPADLPEWAEPVWIDPFPFAEYCCVEVEGRSAIRTANPSRQHTPLRRGVELEAVGRLLGGSRMWWWGTFQVGDALWWSLLGPKGVVESGRIEFDDASPARRALEALHEALPIPDGAEDDTDFTRRVARGALADPQSEQKLADELGDALLPLPLREVLQQASGDEPVSLVVAPAPTLCTVPLCALAIGDGRRLVEAAVVRYAPSAALIAELEQQSSRGQRGRGGPGPVVSGLFDPDRNRPLRHASRLASAAAGGQALIADRATKSSLKAALASASVRPGSPGVFVYSGHARTPQVAGVAFLCLHHDDVDPRPCPMYNCCGGTPLTAAQLYEQDPADPASPYPMPGRVLLSACDTSGGASAGVSGEWLALAPAMMWAGARMVIATSWPTIDDPRTLDMDVAIVEILKTHSDPAEGVRNLQLEKLHRWRAAPDERVPLSPIRGWSPLFWSPYVVVGFHSA